LSIVTLLEVRHLDTRFDTPEGEVKAVNDVSFALGEGETVGVVGESGAGKSQVFLTIMGLLAANGRATGSARFRGTELIGMRQEELNRIRGSRIAMIFQDSMTSLNPYLRISRQLTATLYLHNILGFALEEALRQSGGGGAAPFRLEPHKRRAAPKPPGRKPGHAGEFRLVPEVIDRTIEVPLERCPICGEPVEQSVPVEQTIIELPPVRPEAVRLITYRGRCRRCARVVQSVHPLQVSGACGAAAIQLGPRALASAALLRHGVGLTLRSCCAVLDKLFALRVSPAGLCRGLDRLARRMEGSYKDLAKELQTSAVVHTDETGWWLENERSSLWVFTTLEQTLYRVVKHRDRATLHQTIAPNYEGVLVSDCLSVYDDATAVQQKCYAHHLKAISAAQAARAGPSDWLKAIEMLLRSAMALGKQRGQLQPDQWQQRLSALHLAAHAVLEETPRTCVHEEAVRVFNALTLMQPSVAGHWQNLGTALRPTRRYAQALGAFERALRLGAGFLVCHSSEDRSFGS
jgi:ABC-type oligopeptide transport system ATPase subunit